MPRCVRERRAMAAMREKESRDPARDELSRAIQSSASIQRNVYPRSVAYPLRPAIDFIIAWRLAISSNLMRAEASIG
jgi:hypothetical protein